MTTTDDLVLLDTCGDPADVVVAFLNTLDVEGGTDALASTAEWGGWLRAQAAMPSFPEPDDADLEQARELRRDLRARAEGQGCAEVHSVGVRVALTADGAVQLSATSPVGLVAAAVAKVAIERRLGPRQDLSRRRLPVGLLRHLAQPLAPVVLDGGLRQPRQGAVAPGAGRVLGPVARLAGTCTTGRLAGLFHAPIRAP